MEPMEKEDLVKIKKALTTAYHEKEKAEVGDLWKVRVMGRIRSLSPVGPGAFYFELLQRFLWRFAPVTCVLAVVLTITIARMDFFFDYDFSKIFLSNPADFSLLALYKG